jgi:L-lysine exporter family protein LysE/ArgO
MLVAWFAGLRLGLGLIVAIGAQNAFVMRQGLRREHVLAVALFCAVSDAALIALGVSGFAVARDAVPWLEQVLLWGGITFLLLYGLRSFYAAFAGGGTLTAATEPRAPLGATMLTLAAITWLNPHVWLDTVVFLGSISTQYPGQEAMFGIGASMGSLAFFLALGFGARALAPIFAQPRAWQVFEVLIGLTMWSIAGSLALG